MAKLTKEEWTKQQREKIGYDDLSDEEKEHADECMNQAWDEVMGDKGEDSQDSEDTEDTEKKDNDDDDESGDRGDREIEHTTKDKEEEIDI